MFLEAKTAKDAKFQLMLAAVWIPLSSYNLRIEWRDVAALQRVGSVVGIWPYTRIAFWIAMLFLYCYMSWGNVRQLFQRRVV